VYLEVVRKNKQLTPLPEHAEWLRDFYVRVDARLFLAHAARRPELEARLAVLALARNDTGVA
jgi:hypothetical protein